MKINEKIGLSHTIGKPPQILRIMKLTILIMTLFLLQVSASTNAQITLNAKKESLRKVLKSISKQSGYDFVYTDQDLNKANPIDLQLNNASIENTLKACFEGQPLTYEVSDKTVMIKRKTPSFLDLPKPAFANIDARGKILDENGSPLEGATVVVKGTGRTAKTDAKGEFVIPNVPDNAVLVIRYVGYKALEIALKDVVMPLEIKLEVSFSELQEVEINKGYYTTTERLNTGAVGKITGEQIGRQPVFNVLAALQGQIPGLIITQQTGVPGGGFKVSIRGTNSVRDGVTDYLNGNNGNDALYVIDGIPYFSRSQTMVAVTGSTGLYATAAGANPLNAINPADIESVEILKDADATAIYGSRGANGVILITTKKGNAGQVKFEVNFNSGVGKVTRMMDLLNTQQYLEMRKEAYKNDAVNTYPVNAYDVNGTWDQNRNTDWQKELIGGRALSTNGQLNVSGGTNHVQYRFGGGYNKETSVFPGNFSLQRGSGSFSLNSISANERFKSSISSSYSYSISNLLARDLTQLALTLPPNAPALYDSNGNLNFEKSTWLNPIAYTKQPYNTKSNTLVGNGLFSYELSKGLTFRTNLGYTNTFTKQVRKIPVSSLNPDLPASQKDNQSTFQNGTVSSWNIEPQLGYSVKMNLDHQVEVLVGSTFFKQTTEFLNQTAIGFSSESLMDNVGSVPNANITNLSSFELYKYNAIFGRLSYSYNQRYILNLTGRRDGSSKFGPGKQFGNFGAAGVAWIFSEEKFINKIMPFLNFGKLRGSYGITGNDQIPNYGFQDTYTSTGAGQYQNIAGIIVSRLVNPDFSWETTRKAEIAAELGFIKDKIKLSTTYFHNKSSDQLVGYPLPSSAGFVSIQYNLPATVVNKGWEFEINTLNFKSSKLKWSSSFNLSIPKNELTSYPGLESSSYSSTYVIGEPLSIRRLYNYAGIDPQTGTYKIIDLDNNGTYNLTDRSIYGLLGQTFNGGLSNSISYRGFQADFLFQFVKQNALNYIVPFGLMPGQMSNFPSEVLERWQTPGDEARFQKFSSISALSQYGRYQLSNATVSDASFIRLKNISLGYLIPERVTKRIKAQNARIYLQGQNLFTITNYRGLDPETQGLTLPPLRLLTAGVQLTF